MSAESIDRQKASGTSGRFGELAKSEPSDPSLTSDSTRVEWRTSSDGLVRVMLYPDGDGRSGPYDWQNPDDTPLLRADLQVRSEHPLAGDRHAEEDGWVWLDDHQTTVTSIEADTDPEVARRAVDNRINTIARLLERNQPEAAFDMLADLNPDDAVRRNPEEELADFQQEYAPKVTAALDRLEQAQADLYELFDENLEATMRARLAGGRLGITSVEFDPDDMDRAVVTTSAGATVKINLGTSRYYRSPGDPIADQILRGLPIGTHHEMAYRRQIRGKRLEFTKETP